MTRTEDEAYIVYLQRTGEPMSTRIRTDRRMRQDKSPGAVPGHEVMREPVTWEEAHELAIEFEQQDQNRHAVAAAFAMDVYAQFEPSRKQRRKGRGKGKGGGKVDGDQIQGGGQPRLDLNPGDGPPRKKTTLEATRHRINLVSISETADHANMAITADGAMTLM